MTERSSSRPNGRAAQAPPNGRAGQAWQALVTALSDEVAPARHYPGAVAPPGDFGAEEVLRAQLAEELADVLARRGAGAGRPLQADEARLVDEAIEHAIDRYQVHQSSIRAAGLQDPLGARRRLRAALLGYGVLQPLLDDENVSDILVNRYNLVYVFVHGRFELAEGVRFASEEALRHFAEVLAERAGERLDDGRPLADLALPDGSRVHAGIPPISGLGTTLAIRKFLLRSATLEELVSQDMLNDELASFFAAYVRSRLNLAISGPTGCGKSTLLNAIGAVLRHDPRVRALLVESTRELDLPYSLPNVVQYLTRRPNADGRGEVTETPLVRGGLRLLPSHIIVGEVLGPEAYDMLNALESGHNGLVTVHAMSALSALERLAELASMTTVVALTPELYRAKVARTIGIVVHCAWRGLANERRVVSVVEVTGYRNGQFERHVLWERTPEGELVRRNRPECLGAMTAAGIAYDWPGDTGR